MALLAWASKTRPTLRKILRGTMTRFVRRTLTRAALAAVTVLALAGPAAAADAPGLFARSSYFTQFKEYWGGLFKQSNGITLIVIATGLVALYIITRGKWRK